MKRALALVLSFIMMFGAVAAGFSDIGSHWAQEQIEQLAEQGAISGYPDGTIKPDNTMTRGEFATLLAKYQKLESITPYQPSFVDTAGTWWGGYVESLAARRIIIETEYPDYVFAPDTQITRMEAIKMLVRTLGLDYAVAGNTRATSFADDAQISRENSGYVNLAARVKLLNGDAEGNANVNALATRAENFALITRMKGALRIANDYMYDSTPDKETPAVPEKPAEPESPVD